jgi:hypothetical protein
MLRLSAYMADWARLMGAADQVHFDRIEDSSISIVARVDIEAKPIVSPRVRAAMVGDGPAEAVAAWKKLNEKLTEDQVTGEMKLPGGELIPFPGAAPREQPVGPLRQMTNVQGRLVRLEGSGDRVSVGIEDESDLVGRITIEASLGRNLASYFHQHVRLSGMGRWRRDSEGRWSLEHLEADGFEVLDDTPLLEVLGNVRKLVSHDEASTAIQTIQQLRKA